MIKANELRIGNWVEKENIVFDYAGGCKNIPIKIRVTLSNISEISNSKLFNAIPLTPEILSKLPFEKWNNSNIFSIDFKDGQSIQIRPERKEVVMFGSDAATDGHGFVIDNIEFLHQLQNIFGTIGKELEIKLQPDALI